MPDGNDFNLMIAIDGIPTNSIASGSSSPLTLTHNAQVDGSYTVKITTQSPLPIQVTLSMTIDSGTPTIISNRALCSNAEKIAYLF